MCQVERYQEEEEGGGGISAFMFSKSKEGRM